MEIQRLSIEGVAIFMKMMTSKISNLLFVKKLYESATLPTKGSKYAAGLDLYANNYNGMEGDKKEWTFSINPGETIKVGTGIAVEIPEGYFGGIYARSGLATKQGLAPANKVGVVDSDYRGEVIVALHNHSTMPQFIHKNDRIAQLVIQPYLDVVPEVITDLTDTERGEGGFGSSGS